MAVEVVGASLYQSLTGIMNNAQREELFARAVYDKFFEQEPSAKSLFARTDWTQQRKMLISAMMLMTKNLDKPALFRSTMVALGERHARYGVKAEYFPAFRTALHYALKQELQHAYTPELASAWDHALDQITELMKSAGVG